MFRVFEGRTANDVWMQIAQECKSLGQPELRSGRTGPIFDLENVCFTISDPRQRWIISREPAINPAFAVAEVIWIVTGRNDAGFLNYFNSQLPKFAGEVDEYPGAYGYRLKRNLGFDQLERAYQVLSSNPDSRQVVLQIWDGKADLPHEDGSPSSTDVPCNLLSLLKIRNGCLDWTQIVRSNDMYLGVPHNVVQFSFLQEIVAGWLDLDCGNFNVVTDCMHVYKHDLSKIYDATFITAEVNTDSLSCSRRLSEKYFNILERAIEQVVDNCTSAEKLVDFTKANPLPDAYVNMLCILVAEGLRRRHAHDLIDVVISRCTNKAFIQLWNRWKYRVSMKFDRESDRSAQAATYLKD